MKKRTLISEKKKMPRETAMQHEVRHKNLKIKTWMGFWTKMQHEFSLVNQR
jgi:hypothetical protein